MANIDVNAKQLLNATKATNDLALFQIEALEKDRDNWKNAFEAVLQKVNTALSKESKDEIVADFAELIEKTKDLRGKQ